MPQKIITLRDRLLAKRRINPDTGCWEWTGYILPNGYGNVLRNKYVHRIAYAEFRGPIPDGLVIDHLCRVRHCFNPDHLEAVTFHENLLRGEGTQAQHARQTHCKNGHPFEGENLVMTRAGERRCRECIRAYGRSDAQRDYRKKWEERNKEKRRARKQEINAARKPHQGEPG